MTSYNWLIPFLYYFLTFTLCKRVSSSRHLITPIDLNQNSMISPYFSKILAAQSTIDFDDRKTEKSRQPDYQYFYEDVVINKEIKIQLPKSVGSYLENLEYYISHSTENDKLLHFQNEYGYNISYPEDLITPGSKLLVYADKNHMQNYYFDFVLKQPDIKIDFKSEAIESLFQVISFENLIIGIHSTEKNLRAYSYINGEITPRELSDFFEIKDSVGELISFKINTILLDSNMDHSIRYALLTNENSDIFILKFESISSQALNILPRVAVSINFHFNGHTLLDKYSITDFVQKDELFYIAYANYGIVKYSKDGVIDTKTTFFDHDKNILLNITDLQEVGNAIYSIVYDYGLIILDIASDEEIKLINPNLKHPYFKKIDVHFNPFLSYPFLSILVNQRAVANGGEFYIEMSLKNEFAPIIYRYYLSSRYLDLRYVASDDKFSYLLDYNSNSIFIISRSITATSKNSVYKISKTEFWNKEIGTSPFIFKDENLETKHIGFVTNGRIYYTKTNILTYAEINAVFHKVGNYTLNLYTFSDYCGLDIEKVIMCQISLRYTFIVNEIGLFQSLPVYVITILLLVIGILFVLGIVLFLVKFNSIKSWWIKKRNVEHYYSNPEDENNTYNPQTSQKTENRAETNPKEDIVTKT